MKLASHLKKKILYDSTSMRRQEEANSETENKMVATRGHVMEKKESSCSLGIGKLSVMHDEKVLELFHKSVNILSMTEVVT